MEATQKSQNQSKIGVQEVKQGFSKVSEYLEATKVNDQRQISKYKRSLNLEDFSEEELQFLEKLSSFSIVNTSLQQLNEYNSVESKKDFCEFHREALTPDERYDFEMLTYNFNLQKSNRQPVGLGFGCVSTKIRLCFKA